MTRIFRSEKEPEPLHPDCPGCSKPTTQEWLYVGTSWDPNAWTPGRWECTTVGCTYGPPFRP